MLALLASAKKAEDIKNGNLDQIAGISICAYLRGYRSPVGFRDINATTC